MIQAQSKGARHQRLVADNRNGHANSPSSRTCGADARAVR
ncbi:hypothetical protein GGQ58_004801 [Paracoccus denitrificans]|nr:hypothetical protein [Paracoccus denitrificans]